MTFLDDEAIARLDKAMELMEELQKLGFWADVIPCWDRIPILEIKGRRMIKK